MPDAAKIALSEQELQLVTDPGWILTKRRVIDKVYLLLGGLSERLQQQFAGDWKFLVPPAVLNQSPKIYRGENYRQLPYVLLDYPRCFSGPDVFALRTLFWWGNFFSVTLHLGGRYKEAAAATLGHKLANGADSSLHICINEDQWQHHFEAGNYVPVSALNKAELEQLVSRGSFLKLAVKFPLQEWGQMPVLLEAAALQLLELLKH